MAQEKDKTSPQISETVVEGGLVPKSAGGSPGIVPKKRINAPKEESKGVKDTKSVPLPAPILPPAPAGTFACPTCGYLMRPTDISCPRCELFSHTVHDDTGIVTAEEEEREVEGATEVPQDQGNNIPQIINSPKTSPPSLVNPACEGSASGSKSGCNKGCKTGCAIFLSIIVLFVFMGLFGIFDDKKGTTDQKATPELAATKTDTKDGATMILIPAGEFLMGSNKNLDDEKPQHTVFLDAYYIDKTDVTVAQYRQFCVATGRMMPNAPNWGWVDTHPIVNVTWDDAAAYAVWAGEALPTEAQWEKAARGTDGFIYPWGNDWDAAKCVNNVGGMTKSTQPVDSMPDGASPYGVLDMSGNVCNWCADWYNPEYYNNSPAKNPTGPDNGNARVVRNMGLNGDKPIFFRSSARDVSLAVSTILLSDPSTRFVSIGFRCVLNNIEHAATQSNQNAVPAVPIIPAISTKTNVKDGAIMLLIPAGNFLMGSDHNGDDEKPQHTVFLDDYYIDKMEVTVAQYRKYCQATGVAMPQTPPWGWLDDHPIVNVCWQDATAYAAWAGDALPTEAQWEKAARGIDGRVYPWGNEWDATKCVKDVDGSMHSTQPVGSKPAGASPNGVLDMVGNVSEWCADWYDASYYQNSPKNNPIGPNRGITRVVRVGTWATVYPDAFRTSYRASIDPAIRSGDLGFRCVLHSP